MEEIATAQFWWGLAAVIWVNVILSCDNAVVIALAVRSLPRRQRKQAVYWGAGAAVALRIALTIIAVELLRLPLLKITGGLALLWIAVQLLLPRGAGSVVKDTGNLMPAIKTILVADLMMSGDNVIAVAAAAQGSMTRLLLGLAISMPLVILGATLLLKLMERWPIIITIGAAILGWVAGEMLVTDPVVAEWVDAQVLGVPWSDKPAGYLHWLAPAVGAIAVVVVGKWLAERAEKEHKGTVDLADEEPKA